MKINTKTIENSGNLCAHCEYPLMWRVRVSVSSQDYMKPFYFNRWEYCYKCKAVWFHEEDKVYTSIESQRKFKDKKFFKSQKKHFSKMKRNKKANYQTIKQFGDFKEELQSKLEDLMKK